MVKSRTLKRTKQQQKRQQKQQQKRKQTRKQQQQKRKTQSKRQKQQKRKSQRRQQQKQTRGGNNEQIENLKNQIQELEERMMYARMGTEYGSQLNNNELNTEKLAEVKQLQAKIVALEKEIGKLRTRDVGNYMEKLRTYAFGQEE